MPAQWFFRHWDVQHSSVLTRIFYFLSIGIWGWEIVCWGGCLLIGYNSISILCLPLTVAPLHAFLVVLAKNVSNCSYMFLGWLRMWNLTERGLSKSPGWETWLTWNVDIVSLAVRACLCSHLPVSSACLSSHLQCSLLATCFRSTTLPTSLFFCVLIRTEDNSWPI